MPEGFSVIYYARTVPEAHELKERLIQAGFQAVALDDVLVSKAASNPFGFPEPVPVAVEEHLIEPARRIAEEFDREIVERVEREGTPPATADVEPGGETAETADAWPQCPQCRARRVTVCPVCKTSGSHFPWADPESQPADSARPMVLCPTCDEPFTPQYLRRCEWCNHDFGEGLEPEHDHDAESISPLAVALLLGGVALIVAILVYYMILL